MFRFPTLHTNGDQNAELMATLAQQPEVGGWVGVVSLEACRPRARRVSAGRVHLQIDCTGNELKAHDVSTARFRSFEHQVVPQFNQEVAMYN